MTNLSPNDLTPGSFLQINIPFGPGSGTVANEKTLYVGYKLSTAPAVVNKVYGPDVPGFVVANHAQVLSTFGAGSELNVEYNAGVLNDPNYSSKYFICVPEPSGAAASLTVTFTGSSATTFGSVTSFVNGSSVVTAISPGMTGAQVATAVASSINSLVEVQVSATPSTNTMVVTAKNKGYRGNGIYFACQVGDGLTGLTSSAQSFAYLTGGIGTDDVTDVLLAIATSQFDNIVYPGEDPSPSGDAGLMTAQVISQNLAVPGLDNTLFDGYVGTEAAAAAFTNELNLVFGACAWELNSNYTTPQLAAHLAGCFTACLNQSTPILNMDGVGVRPNTESFWQFSNPFDGTQTSPTDITAALISGLTPIQTTTVGKTMVTKACTMYHVDPSSSTIDLRATDFSDIFVTRQCKLALKQMWSSQFAGKVAAQNPQPGDKAPNDQVITPDILTANIQKVLDRQISNGFIQAYNVQFQSLTDTGTFNYVVEVEPVTLAHQFNVDINSVTTIL